MARRLVRKRKDLDVLPAPVGHPGAAKRSPSHIDPADWSEQDRLAFNRHQCGRRQETANGADAARPIAFGSGCQALLSQRTGLTIGLVGQVDGSLGKLILLTHFAQPQTSPSWAAQLAILLQDE